MPPKREETPDPMPFSSFMTSEDALPLPLSHEGIKVYRKGNSNEFFILTDQIREVFHLSDQDGLVIYRSDHQQRVPIFARQSDELPERVPYVPDEFLLVGRLSLRDLDVRAWMFEDEKQWDYANGTHFGPDPITQPASGIGSNRYMNENAQAGASEEEAAVEGGKSGDVPDSVDGAAGSGSGSGSGSGLGEPLKRSKGKEKAKEKTVNQLIDLVLSAADDPATLTSTLVHILLELESLRDENTTLKKRLTECETRTMWLREQGDRNGQAIEGLSGAATAFVDFLSSTSTLLAAGPNLLLSTVAADSGTSSVSKDHVKEMEYRKAALVQAVANHQQGSRPAIAAVETKKQETKVMPREFKDGQESAPTSSSSLPVRNVKGGRIWPLASDKKRKNAYNKKNATDDDAPSSAIPPAQETSTSSADTSFASSFSPSTALLPTSPEAADSLPGSQELDQNIDRGSSAIPAWSRRVTPEDIRQMVKGLNREDAEEKDPADEAKANMNRLFRGMLKEKQGGKQDKKHGSKPQGKLGGIQIKDLNDKEEDGEEEEEDADASQPSSKDPDENDKGDKSDPGPSSSSFQGPPSNDDTGTGGSGSTGGSSEPSADSGSKSTGAKYKKSTPKERKGGSGGSKKHAQLSRTHGCIDDMPLEGSISESTDAGKILDFTAQNVMKRCREQETEVDLDRRATYHNSPVSPVPHGTTMAPIKRSRHFHFDPSMVKPHFNSNDICKVK